MRKFKAPPAIRLTHRSRVRELIFCPKEHSLRLKLVSAHFVTLFSQGCLDNYWICQGAHSGLWVTLILHTCSSCTSQIPRKTKFLSTVNLWWQVVIMGKLAWRAFRVVYYRRVYTTTEFLWLTLIWMQMDAFTSGIGVPRSWHWDANILEMKVLQTSSNAKVSLTPKL